MITVRRSADRGHADHGWLDSHHTFSFAGYRDPRFMGYRALRVINEDRVAPGGGFPTHGHRDMEILSYVVEGGLAHRDSTGGGSVIRPGDVQRMTAGSGVTHSEENASESEPVHFLQIWILPETRSLRPGYEQKQFPDDERRGRLRVVASRDARDASLTIHQDVTVLAGLVAEGETTSHALAPGRGAWIQIVRGEVRVLGETLRAGDGAAIEAESALSIEGVAPTSEVLLFDLA